MLTGILRKTTRFTKNYKKLYMEQDNIYRLWKFVEFSDCWKTLDTSLIDDISPSWFERRKTLKDNSQEYEDFILRLKREHAIETGIVERMYDLKKGITETFIKEGFVQSFMSHGDTNVPVPKLLSHLKDHFDAVNFVFDVVNENRPLTIGFIKDLQALYAGLGQSHKAMVLQGGMKYAPITIPMDDAQFIATRQHQDLDICGMYKVPPHKIGIHGANSNNNNLEQENGSYVSQCLRPWLVRWEQSMNMQLLTPEQRQRGLFFEILAEGLLRGDQAARAAYFDSMWQ